jgi:thioredoxin-like negative regulator of GroEL
MTNESAKAYIALAVEVEEVRQEVAWAQRRLTNNPTDAAAAAELAEGRELLKRLELAAGVFMGLLQEKQSAKPNANQSAKQPVTQAERPGVRRSEKSIPPARPLHQSADLA